MSAHTLHLRSYVPIPVGHRVEVTCFAQPHLLTGAKPAWDELMVRDLDTGIVYQQPWHVTGGSTISLGRIDYPLETAGGLAVVARMEGRVQACRVMAYSGQGNDRTLLATTLVVEPTA